VTAPVFASLTRTCNSTAPKTPAPGSLEQRRGYDGLPVVAVVTLRQGEDGGEDAGPGQGGRDLPPDLEGARWSQGRLAAIHHRRHRSPDWLLSLALFRQIFPE